MANFSRRDILRLSAAGVTGTCVSGWMNVLAARAAQTRVRHKSCILLYMDGGPTHMDTFDLKPGHANGGPFREIQTSAPGIRISEHLPKLATVMNHGAIIRGMSTGDGNHGTAKYTLHTGYKRSAAGGLTYPSIGSIVSAEIAPQDAPMPNFVTVGSSAHGAGFLGPRHEPLNVRDPLRGVENLLPAVGRDQFGRRVGLLEEMEQAFQRTYEDGASSAHRTTYQRAVSLVQGSGSRAFDISQEPANVRTAYGNTPFGNGCLLARRLIEAGVSFVEVSMGGWDTHGNNFNAVRDLSRQLDPGMSQLVIDLRDRGLLDTTLIVWMGDFGRTPRINGGNGRDHWPNSWSSVLLGGGMRGGQVVGRTDASGSTVVERPVPAIDLMATICLLLGIDPGKMNQTPIGRPIRIVDRAAVPMRELL
jgi:hypothetical protein